MKIRITYPITIGDRVILPGETIDAEESVAKQILTNGWAIVIAEETKHDNRKKRKQVH